MNVGRIVIFWSFAFLVIMWGLSALEWCGYIHTTFTYTLPKPIVNICDYWWNIGLSVYRFWGFKDFWAI